MNGFRVERDSLGEVRVPDERLWGAQTQRALEHFPIGQARFTRPMIRALGVVKKAAALANGALGQLALEKVALIERACDEVIAGLHDAQFPLAVFQSGSGTQTNMNLNEVIANRAIQLAGGALGSKQPVHPNDDVNRSQSTNDVFPTAMHVAAVEQIVHRLLPAVAVLRQALQAKAEEFAAIVKVGRTHLQDAVPLTLGQEVSGWVAQLDQAADRLRVAAEGLYELPLGGTAVGTGLNAPLAFAATATARVAEITGLPFVPAQNKFAAIAAHDAVAFASAALRTLAGSLMKIANDIRWLASGPRAGLGELTLPANEPGSSIMPGKVNPSQAEALLMVVCQVYGNDAAVAFAAAQGNFELNACKPVIVHNLLSSVELLSDACASFATRCAAGIQPNLARIEQSVANSLMLATALNPHIGYDRAAEAALKAHRDGTSLREAAIALGVVTAEQFDAWVNASAMVKPAE